MTDESLLLSRAVERSASTSDWDALEEGARRDPQLAVRLLGELRDACELSAALEARLDALAAVELPIGEGARASRPSSPAWRRPRVALLAGIGWAAACVLATLLVLRGWGDDARGPVSRAPGDPVVVGGDVPQGESHTHDVRDTPAKGDVLEDGDAADGLDALSDALADGSSPPSGEARVLHEFPRVLVETRPTDDGRIEVTWLRRALEQQTVDDAYEIVEDESGRPNVVPADLSMLAVSDIL